MSDTPRAVVLKFDYSFHVDAPVEAVAGFHHDPSALKILTPAWVRLHQNERLAEGSISRFTVWLGPLPVKWTATHVDVTDHGFADIQSAGPMDHWKHTHRFQANTSGGTVVTEHIEFRHRRGITGIVTRIMFNRASLNALFRYRSLQTRRHSVGP